MSVRTPFDSHGTIVRATLLAVIPAVLAIALAASGWFVDDVAKALYAGAGAMIFGGLLGGLLKLLLDDVVLTRSRRADAATFVGNVLQDLKSVHDRVERARMLIIAHQSAKTYGDEMRDLIGAEVQLRNVTRALERQADGIRPEIATAVNTSVNLMRDYLQALTTEFVHDYKPIADLQRLHEKRVSLRVERAAKAHGTADTAAVPNEPWKALLALPGLREFVQSSDGYESGFGKPLDDASAALRRELAWIHGAGWNPVPGAAAAAAAPAVPPARGADGGVVAGPGAPSIAPAMTGSDGRSPPPASAGVGRQ
jgi:hypothetical protein